MPRSSRIERTFANGKREVSFSSSANGGSSGLSAAGRVIIIIVMFVGRLGPLTVALIVGSSSVSERIRYPEEEVVGLKHWTLPWTAGGEVG